MDAEQFRKAGHELVDWIADYYTNIEKYRVFPETKPHDVIKMLPKEAPLEGESWEAIKADVEKIIVPNITHWQSPNFFAFFSSNSSFPAILGDMLSSGLGVQGMMWVTSPACTELEVVVMDWLGKMCGLPKAFLCSKSKTGGGVIQGTASEVMLVNLVAARNRSIKRLGLVDDANVNAKLVVYVSNQTHSGAKKATMIAGIHASNVRVLETDPKTLALLPETLEKAILADEAAGLIPCYFVSTIGTTSTTAYDPLADLGKICNAHNVWMHVDAAYAGAALVCPEYRHFIDGLEFADSFNFNPHKWLLVNFDCSASWVKNRNDVVDALSITPEYLRNKATESGEVFDFRDWQVPLGRRFRSLKLWFVLRSFGQIKMQEFIRNHVRMATEFENWVRADDRFEIAFPRMLALVTFKLKAGGEQTKQVYETINAEGKFYLTHSIVNGTYIIRINVGTVTTQDKHVKALWEEIQAVTARVLGAQ
jgi:glutamate/tyrosine decarboxylase-like PLP-dependent enzyme